MGGAALTGHIQVLSAPPSGSGWLPYHELSAPAGLQEIISYVRRAAPGASDTVAAALFATSVTGAFAAPLTGALLAERRVPAPASEEVWLQPSFTGVGAIAIGAAELTVLPGDPAAGQPGVAVADDLDQLRRVLIERYRGLLAPFLTLVASSTQRGRRALWADAGDRLATYLLMAGRALGDPAAGRAEADALLALAEPPLRHDVRWLEFEHRGAATIWKRRSVCCLVYQAPSWKGQYCATCPLVPVDDTIARTRAWLG